MSMLTPTGRLEDQNRDQLLSIARRLLVEADALSSRIAAVNEIGIAINRTLDLNAIQRVIAKQAKWLLDFEYCSVCLQQEEPNSWKISTLFGTAEADPDNLLETDNVGQALRGAYPRLILEGSPSPFLNTYPSQIIIPLVTDDVVMGTINFATRKPRAYTQDDMRIGYMLALQLSSAIRNTRMFEELRKTRDELRAYAIELEARNQELDAYSHTIAHDLKSPLNSLILKSELAALRFADDLSPEAIQFIEGIKDGGLKMNEMIDQLLWLARLRNLKDALIPVMIKPVVEAALARFSPALESGKITVEISPELPSAIGHAQWIEEVFANLISNAIKYMGAANQSPKITIRGSIQGDQARYEIQDTGIGISTDDQARLFQMFTRFHTVQADGLGLGLSIVHRIVTKLNGQIGVISAPEAGSTFWFALPVVPVPSVTVSDTTEAIPTPDSVVSVISVDTAAPLPSEATIPT